MKLCSAAGPFDTGTAGALLRRRSTACTGADPPGGNATILFPTCNSHAGLWTVRILQHRGCYCGIIEIRLGLAARDAGAC